MRFASFLCFVLVVIACGKVDDPYRSACARLSDARTGWNERCEGSFDPPSRDTFVASCIGSATATGSLVTPEEIDACARSYADRCRLLGPSCSGSGADILFPNHDKKGTLANGAPCFAQIECASGWCTVPFGKTCGTCTDPPEPPGLREGEKCMLHGQNCQLDLDCIPISQIEGICTRRQPLGASCGAAVGPGQSRSCEAGSFCSQDRCVPLLEDGARGPSHDNGSRCRRCVPDAAQETRKRCGAHAQTLAEQKVCAILLPVKIALIHPPPWKIGSDKDGPHAIP